MDLKQNPTQKKKVFTSFLISFKIFVFLTALLWPKTAWQSSITPQNVLDLTNKERISYQLEPLTYSSTLEKSAQEKANDLITKNYFEHDSPTGTPPWYWFEKNGYDYKYAGENLAQRFDTAEKLHEIWMGSPTHRANILHPKFKEMGVGIAKSKLQNIYTTVVVSHFGTRNTSVMANLTNKNDLIKKLKFWEEPLAGPLDLIYLVFGSILIIGIAIAAYQRFFHKKNNATIDIKYKSGLLAITFLLIVFF